MVNKPQNTNHLFSEIKQLIEEARQNVAIAVNSTTTVLYWNVGTRINSDILENKRAEYGKEVVISLAKSLTEEYGKGWSEKQLRHCLRIAETFPDKEILYALSRQLTWQQNFVSTKIINLFLFITNTMKTGIFSFTLHTFKIKHGYINKLQTGITGGNFPEMEV